MEDRLIQGGDVSNDIIRTDPELNAQGKPEIKYQVGYFPSRTEVDFLIVFVFDLRLDRIIFKTETRKVDKVYNYIKSHYGKQHCIPPRQINPDFL